MESFVVFIHPLSEVLETVRRTFIHGVSAGSTYNIVDVHEGDINRSTLPEGPCLLVGDDLKACFAYLLKSSQFLRKNVTLSLFTRGHLSLPVRNKILDLVQANFLVGFERPDLIKAVLTNILDKLSSRITNQTTKKEYPTTINIAEITPSGESATSEMYRFFVSMEKRKTISHPATVVILNKTLNHKNISPDILDNKSTIWPFTLYEVNSSTGLLETILEANRPVESLADDVIKSFRDGKKVLAVKNGQWNTYLEATKAQLATLHRLKSFEEDRGLKKAA